MEIRELIGKWLVILELLNLVIIFQYHERGPLILRVSVVLSAACDVLISTSFIQNNTSSYHRYPIRSQGGF